MPEPFPRAPAAFDWSQARVVYRENLPHVAQADAVYFVTFRLHDSIPLEKLRIWRWQLRQWEQANPPPYTPHQEDQYAALGYRRVERWLDRHTGSCLLADERCHTVIADCLTRCDGERLWLGDYIVMPNHVHALLRVATGEKLEVILDAWYGTTTHQINRLLERRGRLWESEPFDHIVRDEVSLQRIRRYIKENGRNLPADRYHYGCGQLFQ